MRFLLIEALVASVVDAAADDAFDAAADDDAVDVAFDAAAITVRKAGGSIWEWRGWGTNAVELLKRKRSCHTSTRPQM